MARRAPQTKPAGQVLADLRKRIESGWPAGLTLLTGDDLYHLDRAKRALLDALVPGGPAELGLSVFSEERVDVGVVVSAARSVGMFSERRVVLVRDLAALDGDSEPLVRYAADPPAASYLLVRAPDLDRRRKLHQALVKSGRLLEFVSQVQTGRSGSVCRPP